jgi:hypothetical protein
VVHSLQVGGAVVVEHAAMAEATFDHFQAVLGTATDREFSLDLDFLGTHVEDLGLGCRQAPPTWEGATSRKWVFGLAPKSHLSRLGLSMGTNDRHWSRFVPFDGWSRFISENRSRFVA